MTPDVNMALTIVPETLTFTPKLTLKKWFDFNTKVKTVNSYSKNVLNQKINQLIQFIHCK